MLSTLLLIAVALAFCFQIISAGNFTDTAQDRSLLRRQIFSNYDKDIIPDNVTVQLGFALIRLDAHPEINRLDMFGWLRIVWHDSRLKWNHTKGRNNNVQVLRLPGEDVWKPDIVLYNGYDPEKYWECAPVQVLVYPSGEVLWVPPCSFKVICDMQNLRNNPSAKHSCPLKFGSWTVDGDRMGLELYKNIAEVDMSDFWDVSPNWRVAGTTANRTSKKYSCCPEPYPHIFFNVDFERRAASSSAASFSMFQVPTQPSHYILHSVFVFLTMRSTIQATD